MLKTKKLLTNQSFNVIEDKNVKLYPKCDCSVWLRSCNKEVIEPIEGTIHGTIPKWLRGRWNIYLWIENMILMKIWVNISKNFDIFYVFFTQVC